MSVYEKLLNVQGELKAPKGQFNSFGKYKYRSCEDILEAVKPLLLKHAATLTVGDELVMVGERIYIKATANFCDIKTGERVTNTAFAREDESKKGMDGSQITGTASSYARKYCLNGLFLIDDTKAADTDEFKNQQSKGDNPAEDKQKQEAINITSVSENGFVRFINGVQCQVLAANNNWYDVEFLPIKSLEQLLDEGKYANAYEAIRAAINAKAIAK